MFLPAIRRSCRALLTRTLVAMPLAAAAAAAPASAEGVTTPRTLEVSSDERGVTLKATGTKASHAYVDVLMRYRTCGSTTRS